MIELQEIFDIRYGNNFDLNKLQKTKNGINFVSRTFRNNGVSARVLEVDGAEKMPKNSITVSLGGSILEAFFQPQEYYTGYHIYCLTTKNDISLSDSQKLFYCSCIRANKYKYNYGRQANRTLKNLLVPSIEEIPRWVNTINLSRFDGAEQSLLNEDFNLNISSWQTFRLDELFLIKKGIRLTKRNMLNGNYPFIGSTDKNNGVTAKIGQKPIHQGNVITINYNGSVGEAFYQPKPFWASDDVNVLYPIDEIFPRFNQYIALFIIPIIKQNKFKFNYGRKWHLERMNESTILLPAINKKRPDIDFMENYIKSLPFSKSI